jgi:carbonic anhydrase/acetyltransferase-like protein (isoleucine patch superfamily)
MIYALGDRSPVFEGDDHFVADNATIIGHVRLKSQSSVWFNAVLRGDNDWIEIGARSNVQDGSVLHTDPGIKLTVGDDVTIGHKVMLHGCTIGNNSLIGIGSTLLNGVSVGDNCIVGAHSLLTENKSFPAGSLIMGTPARVIRELTTEEISLVTRSAASYVENSKRFRLSLSVHSATD